MSGFIGTLRLDGGPADVAWLEATVRRLAFRGPDALSAWSDGPVGLGCAALRTTDDTRPEMQPCSLDGRVWIAADARVDGRRELVAALRANGRDPDGDAPDVELVLHAYHAWGASCVERLIGDFAFVIWNGRARELFCARDHFGAAPFYYFHSTTGLAVANTLDALRLHPGVSDTLDEQAICDFLLFSLYQDPGLTIYSDIRSLPPAHTLTVRDGRAMLRRYWQPPESVEPTRNVRPEELVGEFRSVLDVAVRDRLRTGRVGTTLSGGLDSGCIAALAQQSLHAEGRPFELRGATIVYEHLIPDREGEFARLTAEHCGLRTTRYVAEDFVCGSPTGALVRPRPEPWALPGLTAEERIQDDMAAFTRVYLMGFGGDPLLSPSDLPWWEWLRLGHPRRAAGRLRRDFRRWRFRKGNDQVHRDELGIIHPGFARRSRLAERRLAVVARYRDFNQRRAMATAPLWDAIFRWGDPGFTGLAMKVRWPFFDLRLFSLALALPDPLLRDKGILREALRNVLPEAVRTRPKTILAGLPYFVLLRERGFPPWMKSLATSPSVEPYIDLARIGETMEHPESMTPTGLNLVYRVLALADWMLRRERNPLLAVPGQGEALLAARSLEGVPRLERDP